MSTSAEPAEPTWLQARREVLLWIAAGHASFLLAFALCWAYAPRIAPVADPVDRLLLAVQLGALPGVVLGLVLQTLWRVAEPDPQAENPLLGRESRRFQINQRVMTNTVEQALIFLPIFLALAVRVPPEQTWALPLLMGLWTVGRLLFWVGYNLGTLQRAIGMDWTTGAWMVAGIWLASTFA